MSAPRLLRTTSFRLALGYLALFGGSAVVLLAFIYWQTAGYMTRQLDETIEAEVIGLSEQYRQGGVQGLAASINQRISRDPAGSEVYLLVDPAFRPVTGNLDRWPNAEETSDGRIEFELRDRTTPRGETYLAHTRHFRLGGGFHLLVGRDARAIEQTQQLILRSLIWGLAITLALGLTGGALLARGAVRRLEAINRTSREIIGGDFSRRVPTRGSRDEFDQLAQNLNAMLDRIETLMASIRHVSEGVAHDLRSPLTRLRQRLEMAQRPTQDHEERRRLVEESLDEADSLLATFNALLRITEAESGKARAGFSTVDFTALVEGAVELYEPVAQDKHQTISARLAPGQNIAGDPELLSQAIANLLDNAIKYTPEGGAIAIELASAGDIVTLTIADNGPGVPVELRAKVLERFFRVDPSRTTPGSGLGLSLVAAVAGLHEAPLRLDDNHPGLKVTLSFKRAGGAMTAIARN